MVAGLIGLAVFGATLVACFLVFIGLTEQREAQRMELARRLGSGDRAEHELFAREVDTLGTMMGPAGSWLHRLTMRAGGDYTVTQIVMASVMLAAVTVFLLFVGLGVVYAPFGLAAGLLPFAWLVMLKNKRARRITEQMPDALDLMGRALRSGHAFGDALRLGGEEMAEPIGYEMAQTSEEHRLGLELRSCLEGLAQRTPENFELRMLVSAVLLHRETGGNLIEMLENLADTIRERLVFERKVQALTAEVRASAAILALMPFGAAIGLLVFEPDYLTPLLTPGWGYTLLAYGVTSMIVGMIVMRRISTVEF